MEFFLEKSMEFLQKPKLTRGSVLRWSPYAWAKLLHFRDINPTEVGGYGLTETDDALLITDIVLVKQEVTSCTLEFDTKDSMEFVERMTDKGLSPFQHSNIFWHSHPGNCPNPSIVDENNFNKNFSHPDWAIFFIIARGGSTYCRVRHNIGPGIEVTISTEIDYSHPFPASDHKAWDEEYKEKVTETKFVYPLMGDKENNYKDLMNKLHGNMWPYEHQVEQSNFTQPTIEELLEKEEMDENLQMWWDQSEDCVWFYNDEEEDYWKYSPVERAFFDTDDSRISVKNVPKECKISEVIRFGVKCYKDQMQIYDAPEQPIEDSFLREVEEVELCQEMAID